MISPRPINGSEPLQRESGLTLIEMMIAIAITGILALVVAGLIKSYMDHQVKVKQMREIETVRNTLRSTLDCVSTMASRQTTTYIILRDRNGRPIGSTSSAGAMRVSTEHGEWQVRGRSYNAGTKILNIDLVINGVITPLFGNVPYYCP